MSETIQDTYKPSTEAEVPATTAAAESQAADDSSSWEFDKKRLGAHIILSIFPIFQIAMGGWYQNDCPKQPYIPIYLEVMGSYILALLCISLYFPPQLIKNKPWRVALTSLKLLFFISWFIAGNVWIYSIYEPNYNKLTPPWDPYCHKTLYLFAFWSINVTYILTGLLCCCICCVACLSESFN